jgi:uncharacterized protein (DUF433 family)
VSAPAFLDTGAIYALPGRNDLDHAAVGTSCGSLFAFICVIRGLKHFRQFFFDLTAVAILFNKPVTASSLIVSDPEILGGTPVFKGTRVPVRTLFEYLADGLSLEYFLETFPSVTRDQATDLLRLSQQRIEQEIAA